MENNCKKIVMSAPPPPPPPFPVKLGSTEVYPPKQCLLQCVPDTKLALSHFSPGLSLMKAGEVFTCLNSVCYCVFQTPSSPSSGQRQRLPWSASSALSQTSGPLVYCCMSWSPTGVFLIQVDQRHRSEWNVSG